MRILTIFLFLLLVCCKLNAQEDTLKASQDNLRQHSKYFDNDFDLYFPHFIPPDPYDEKGSVKLLSSFLLSSTVRDEFFLHTEPHLLSNYHKFYLENSRIDPVRYILGMAQLGAVGYLAYRHIKKYGLK